MIEMITVIMVQMLLEDKRRDEVGLLVDWLELLDPTIISSCPELQMKLVFGKCKVSYHVFLSQKFFISSAVELFFCCRFLSQTRCAPPLPVRRRAG